MTVDHVRWRTMAPNLIGMAHDAGGQGPYPRLIHIGHIMLITIFLWTNSHLVGHVVNITPAAFTLSRHFFCSQFVAGSTGS